MTTFPVTVWVDDQCDGCGKADRFGVSWGYQRPVLCLECVTSGATALANHPGGPPALSALLARKRRTALEQPQ